MFLKINEKEYKVKFDFNALSDMEQQAGKGIAEIMKEQAIGFSTIRLLLWSALHKELGNITLDKAGDICQQLIEEGMSFSELTEKFVNALMQSGLLGTTEKK